MQLLFLILADAATVVEGKLYLLGGGWTKITTALPSQQLTHLAAGIKIAWNETDEKHTFLLSLTTPAEEKSREIAGGEFQIGKPQDIPQGSEQTVLLAMPLVLQLEEQPGRYFIKLLVDGEELGSIDFLTAKRP